MIRDIFISYSRHDKDIVIPYVNQISKAVGKDCWIDLNGIESGVEFERVIIKAIEECKVVLFMLSDSSLKSDWTKREVYYAEKRKKHIVPVVLDGKGLRDWFDFHFGNIDYIDIRSKDQKEKLIENLRTWLDVDPHEYSPEPFKWTQRIKAIWRSTSIFVKLIIVFLFLTIAVFSTWTYLSRITEELASGDNMKIRIVKNGWGKYGLKDTSGNLLVPCMWDATGALFYEGLLRVKVSNGKWGFVDETGRVVIPCEWEYADDFSEGLAAVENDNGKWGYIDKTGEIVIPFDWDAAFSFASGKASAKDRKGMCTIDKTGSVVMRDSI